MFSLTGRILCHGKKKKNINDNKKRTTFFKRVKQQWVLVGDLVTNVSRYLYKYNMVVILGFSFFFLIL